VRPETRAKVLEVIEELNFTPNVAARRLSMGVTKSIAVVLPSLIYESTFERIKGIQIAADQTDYDLVLYTPNTIEKREKILEQIVNGGLSDGVILVSFIPTDEELAFIENSATPIIFVEAAIPDYACVHVDNQKGGYMAAQHLIELGHQNIGIMTYLLGEEDGFSPMRARYDGFKAALRDAGLAFDDSKHRVSPHMLHDAERVAKEWLSSHSRPSAIFASSDIQAIGVIKAAKNMGIRVPEDLSVIGFDDIESAHLMDLTTIKQPLYESGVQAFEMLMTMIQDPSLTPVFSELPLSLFIRNTTKHI
jgi:DNA-binding LacI/PurR family transcriptional regulator